MHRSSSVYKQKQFKNMSEGFDVRGQQEMDFFTGGSVMDYELKKCLDGFVSYKHTAFHFT